MSKPSITVVGFGVIGSAIARKLKEYAEVFVIEHVKEKAEKARLSGFDAAENLTPFMFLAVKPQDFSSLGRRLQQHDGFIISCITGISITQLRKAAPRAEGIIRIMPNIAITIGKASIGICYEDPIQEHTIEKHIKPITEQRKEIILSLLSRLGTVIPMTEETLPAFTAVSGSGIAFALRFIHALALGAVAEGIPYNQALQTAGTVTEGAALLLKENTQIHPEKLVSDVCSAKGTTIQGIRALEEMQFQAAVMKAVSSAAMRAKQLEEQS